MGVQTGQLKARWRIAKSPGASHVKRSARNWEREEGSPDDSIQSGRNRLLAVSARHSSACFEEGITL